MVIYSVTVQVEGSIAEDWLQWMRAYHIPDVLATGYFTGHRIQRLVHPETEDGHATFNIQYLCRHWDDYNNYQRLEAPRLQAEHTERYRDRFVAFRTLLEEVE
ncbi:MAG: DUF4286 family protein [Bacteroidetes bacterium]|nr:DUF4286 family protein [Bacteroidota bacterium]